jgi:hypothetical protein
VATLFLGLKLVLTICAQALLAVLATPDTAGNTLGCWSGCATMSALTSLFHTVHVQDCATCQHRLQGQVAVPDMCLLHLARHIAAQSAGQAAHKQYVAVPHLNHILNVQGSIISLTRRTHTLHTASSSTMIVTVAIVVAAGFLCTYHVSASPGARTPCTQHAAAAYSQLHNMLQQPHCACSTTVS